jgi:hypothetical protein
VRISSRPVIAVAAVVLLWVGFAYTITKPADAKAYLRTAMQVAESAHDAAVTGALIARQQIGGQVFGAFAVAAYDDAAKGLAGAAKKLAGQPPPDPSSARLRDQLAPLVQTAVRELSDAAVAETDDARRAAAGDLDGVAGRLSTLIEQHR